MNGADIDSLVHIVVSSDTDDFVALASIAGLDPANDFRYANLHGVDFSGLDLSGFDFTGARMRRCCFRNARIKTAIFTGAELDEDALAAATDYMGSATHTAAMLAATRYPSDRPTGKNKNAGKVLVGSELEVELRGLYKKLLRTGVPHRLLAQLKELNRKEGSKTGEYFRQTMDATTRKLLFDQARGLLSNLGVNDRILCEHHRTVERYRHLSRWGDDTSLSDLAMSLEKLSAHLSNLGRFDEALAASMEATAIRRRQAEIDPGGFLSQLAFSLNNLSVNLFTIERINKAINACKEAVLIRKNLLTKGDTDAASNLSICLNNLGVYLFAGGDIKASVDASRAAVAIRRRLAAGCSDSFSKDLAVSLNNLGTGVSALGHKEEATIISNEAADIWKRLAGTPTQGALGELAHSLGDLSQKLALADRPGAAAVVAAEGLLTIAKLLDRHPQNFADLARALTQSYIRACVLGRIAPESALLERVAHALGIVPHSSLLEQMNIVFRTFDDKHAHISTTTG